MEQNDLNNMLKITIELDNGLQSVNIVAGHHEHYTGWWLEFQDGGRAFIRYQNDEWVQRIDDNISINDIARIIDAMHECAVV